MRRGKVLVDDEREVRQVLIEFLYVPTPFELDYLDQAVSIQVIAARDR